MDNIDHVIHKIVKDIEILAPLIMWNIWCIRNKLVFGNIHPDKHSTVPTIFFQLHLAYKSFGTDSLVTHISTPRMVSLQHGDEDTIILNVDGSALNNPGKAGYGGLIRKHDGSFFRGFFGSVGISNILHAEIQVLFTGIKLCLEAGYIKLICFSDSLYVV